MMLSRPVTRIVYWPFALPSAMLAGADRWLRTNLDQIGASYELQTWLQLDHHTESDLDGADLLFVGGGNTFHLLDQVTRAGLIDVVGRFVDHGGDYYGGSAGAVLACDNIAIAEGHDPNEARLLDLRALHLISNTSILPHFTIAQLDTARRWAATGRSTLIGLPENAGLCHDNGTFTVVGDGTVSVMNASTTRAYRTGQSFTVHQPR